MQIKKIDDKEFREETIKSFHWHDSQRRWEIHESDLINCLLCSFKRKVLPEPNVDTEESYGEILNFIRGIGIDNLITQRFTGKVTTWIDSAQGNIDMMFKDIPYELTSSTFIGRGTKESDDLDGKYQYKIEQLKTYMASLGKTTGRLKIVELVGKRTDKGLVPIEHTWQITMTPLELARHRITIINRKNILLRVLATGNLSTLKELRDIYTPISKSSRCIAMNGFCKEWGDLKGAEPARRQWLTEMYRRYDRTSPILTDLRSQAS